MVEYVSTVRHRLAKACEVARRNLKVTQDKMRERHDKKSQIRNFSPEDRVLVLLPVPGQPLQARYFGPSAIERRVNETDYVVTTPDRRKKWQLSCQLTEEIL